MTLEKIGTKDVVTVPAKTTVLDAAKIMRESHVGDVVVVPEGDSKLPPLGILTDRDIVMSVVAYGIAPESVTVDEVMMPTLAVAKKTDSFSHILGLMKENGIRRIPLVNQAGSVEGIISTDDVISLLASELSDVARVTERQRNIEVKRRRKLA